MTALPDINDVARWRMQPGDVLVLTVDAQITRQQAQALREAWRSQVKQEPVDVVVLGGGLRLQVVNVDALNAVDMDGNRFMWHGGQWLAVDGPVKGVS